MTETINNDEETIKYLVNNLYSFYQYFIINHFNKNRYTASHINKITKELVKLYNHEYEELIISIAPRHSKSSLITLAFPIWLICHQPQLKILIVNSTAELSKSFGLRIREIMTVFEEILPIRLSRHKHSSTWIMFEDKENGELTGGSIRLTGVGGQITGFDADYIIVDDLVKGVSDTTPTRLKQIIEYYTAVIVPRIEPQTRTIVLGTRWHTEDIIGYLLRKKKEDKECKKLILPAYDENGVILWKERYDRAFFDKKEQGTGTRMFQAQYLCKPLDETGDYFNINKLRFVNDRTMYNLDLTVRSWDCAYTSEKEAVDSDYTGIVLMSRTKGNHYLIHDINRERYGENLLNVIKSTARLDTPNIPILIETGTKGGASKFLFEEYKKHLQGFPVYQSEPLGSKVDRATPFRNAILDGRVLVDLPPEKRELLLMELKGFPLAKHDDIVDACSYAYNYLQKDAQTSLGVGKKRRRKKL